MKKLKTAAMVIVLFYLTVPSRAQSLHYPFMVPVLQAIPGSPAFADAFSMAFNSALLPEKGWFAGAYAEKKFLIEGLNTAMLSFNLAGTGSAMGIALARTGNSDYNESRVDFHYTRSLGKVNVGGMFRYSTYGLRGYGRSGLPAIGLATVWKLTGNLYSSIQIINPEIIRLARHPEEMDAPQYHFGIGFEPSGVVSLGFEMIKRKAYPLQVTGCILYRPGEKYMLKGGWTSIGPQPFIALYWNSKIGRVGAALTFHPLLGVSPGAIFLADGAHPVAE